jgi:hypothetical protein
MTTRKAKAGYVDALRSGVWGRVGGLGLARGGCATHSG